MKAFLTPPSFFSLFFFCCFSLSFAMSSLHSHCLWINLKIALFFKVREKKKWLLYTKSINKVFVCDWTLTSLLLQSLWGLPDSYLFSVCSFVVPCFWLLQKAGERMRCIYGQKKKKVREPCMRVSHLSHNPTRTRVTLWTMRRRGKKNKTKKTKQTKQKRWH